MPDFLLRPKAHEDLEDVWQYTIGNWGEEQAESYLRQIDWAFHEISRHPKLGTRCYEIKQGYRKHLVGLHIIFYRETPDKIDIVRVLHYSMDFRRHL